MPVEGRGLGSRQRQDVGKDGRLGNLFTPISVQRLQTALHAKAKAEAGFRFYALYDKIHREDILAHAFALCRANQGAAGVDRQDFAEVEAYGVERWLGELAQALRDQTYRAQAIRRVYIPKANGKLRPLGISTLRDRVVMRATMLVVAPIFEADLPSEQYAYRPGRSALDAVREVEGALHRGHRAVVDADLSDYFGSIPHAPLLKSVARWIVDRRVLHLIKQWLQCPVEETDRRGRRRRTTAAKDGRRGIPQGSPISPLLAKLYMRRFVLGWKRRGLENRLGSRIVTYADDLVILCRNGQAEEALGQLRKIMGVLELTVNEEKTRICQLPDATFDFLGYMFARLYSPRTGRPYLGAKPSQRSVKVMTETIRGLTAQSTTGRDTTVVVKRLNRSLRGWANHFQWGSVSKAYKAIDAYTTLRLRRWLRKKHKVRRNGMLAYPPRVSLSGAGSDLPAEVQAQRAVGEGVRSCPRARCRRPARRVR